MSVQKHRIVSGEDSDVHDEPHLESHRITVRQIYERVTERGLDPETVAKRYNLPVTDIYRALTYYYDHPEEMEASTNASANANGLPGSVARRRSPRSPTSRNELSGAL